MSRSSNSILRDVFARRAQAFHRSVFDDQFDKLTGAILSIGDYSRRLNNERIHLFGSINPRAWSELLGCLTLSTTAIAFLRTELKITDAQSSAWNAFADALRSNAKSLGEVL